MDTVLGFHYGNWTGFHHEYRNFHGRSRISSTSVVVFITLREFRTSRDLSKTNRYRRQEQTIIMENNP